MPPRAGKQVSPSKPLAPSKVVASFDSASVLHAALVCALRGKPFDNLGNPEPLARAIRVGGRLPWPILREIYRRLGGAEGIATKHLRDVDMELVAQSFVDAYPRRNYPAALIGSSNGALAHLAACLQIPWLPQTVLIPVHRIGDPDRPDQALEFGRRWGPEVLEPNPDVTLHQMHDSAQDRLMTARMAYFRLKWNRLPDAFARFLSERLAPGAPVLVADDQLRWPVTRVGDRHYFQAGGLGGLSPQQHLESEHAPAADSEAPEAEWGADPDFVGSIAGWCSDHGRRPVRIAYHGPQQLAHPVASTIRSWMCERDERTDRMIIPSFILGDPWRTLDHGLVPFWTFFPVRDAVESLDRHLELAEPYRTVQLLGFQHGVSSPGVATPDDFIRTVRRHGAEPQFLGVDPDAWPHDIAAMARYGRALDGLPFAERPWSPMKITDAVAALCTMPEDCRIIDDGATGHGMVT